MKWFEKNIGSLFSKKEESKQSQKPHQSPVSAKQPHQLKHVEQSKEEDAVEGSNAMQAVDPVFAQLVKCAGKKKKLRHFIRALYLSRGNPNQQEIYQSLYYKQSASTSQQFRHFFNKFEHAPDLTSAEVFADLRKMHADSQPGGAQEPGSAQMPPLLLIASIGFHHTKGAELEFLYPSDLEQLFHSQHDLEYIKDKVTQYSLPDAVHNKNQDYIYFILVAQLRGAQGQAQQHIVFGTSYFKQIATTEEMRAINADITRSHIQKAICILSFYPLFGYLQLKLFPTIEAYFMQKDLKDYSILQSSFITANKSISDTKQNIEESELYTGLQPKVLLQYFQDRVLQLLKAVLLEKRVVVYSAQSQTCTNFILSLLSLLPSQMHFQFANEKIQRVENLNRDYGFPLQIYNEVDRMLWVYFNISDLDQLKGMKSYMIGTTNVMIKQHKSLQADVMVDLQAHSVKFRDELTAKQLALSKHEKKFISTLFSKCALKKLATPHNQMFQFNDIQNENASWIGSDDHVRSEFHKYFKQMAVELSLLLLNYNRVTENIQKKI